MESTGVSTSRRFAREDLIEPLEVLGATTGAALGVLRNVSRCGALVVSGARFCPGELVHLQLYGSDDDGAGPRLVLEARVVRVERRPADLLWAWAVGLEFAQDLPTTVFTELVPEPDLPHTDVPFAVEVQASSTREEVALSQDFAATGAMLLCRHRFQVGERFRITACPGAGTFPGAAALEGRSFECRVVRIERSQEDSFWRWAVAVVFEAPAQRSSKGTSRAA